MKVLLIKTSSLGDVIHTLPALTDAVQAVPGIRFTWLVEEAYAEIPSWHPGVGRVIPVALRRWGRHPLQAVQSGEWRAFRRQLADTLYDRVIDAQGLLKSAWLALLAKGIRCGPGFASAREWLAAFAYQRRYPIPAAKKQHAIIRMRQLLASALDYPCPGGTPDYGLDIQLSIINYQLSIPYVLFLHGTVWPTKQWPEAYWIELGRLVNQAGYSVYLPWGNLAEQERAARIAGALERARVLPSLSLQELAAILSVATGVVGVDTGLSHLAAALDVPAVTLYGATNPELTGAWGKWQQNLKADFLCAPCLNRVCHYRGPVTAPKPACYSSLSPASVWQALRTSLSLTLHETGFLSE
jgi:heptosyltransferase-1